MNIVLKCFVMIISTVITVIVIPYIKDKIGNDKWNKLQELTELAVRYAEQSYSPEQWKEKKNYVYKYILRKADELGLSLSEQDIDILVEGVVNIVKGNYE